MLSKVDIVHGALILLALVREVKSRINHEQMRELFESRKSVVKLEI